MCQNRYFFSLLPILSIKAIRFILFSFSSIPSLFLCNKKKNTLLSLSFLYAFMDCSIKILLVFWHRCRRCAYNIHIITMCKRKEIEKRKKNGNHVAAVYVSAFIHSFFQLAVDFTVLISRNDVSILNSIHFDHNKLSY